MGRVTQVSVLRGVAVRRDGEWVEVTGTRLRALLALLAIAPGSLRRAEYLADQLWNGEPPSANALQALISRLRRVVGPEVLLSRPTGYLLDLDPADVDLARFEQLAEVGTPAAAREALGLAGPEPLAEFADVPDLAGLARVIDTECARLEAPAAKAPATPPAASSPVSAAPVPTPSAARTSPTSPPAPIELDGQNVAHRLIGRDALLGEIHERLGRTRLLTLTGAGGSGKTSLAKAVAHTHATAHVAELAPVSAQAVDAEVFAAVGGREGRLAAGAELSSRRIDTRDEASRLLDALGDRTALLVLDNCEHVIDAAAGLAAKVLAACPQVTILATSREPLGIPGEQRLPVVPLSVPPPGSAEDRLTAYSAMQLLLERGRAVRPGLSGAGQDGAALAEICRRLDGIPLALELAAARFGVLTPRQVADRLDDRFRLLTTGARTALPRQQTLRAVVDWSWDLLDRDERKLLAVCGVFAGGAALEDLEAVAGLDAVAVLDLVDRLVTKSLMLAEVAPRPIGAPDGMRYRLLETIREYALERLAEHGSRELVQRRHAYHFADLAQRAQEGLRGPRQLEFLGRMDESEDNFRAAITWALEHDEADCALRISGGLAWYSVMRGEQFDRTRSQEALALADRHGVRDDELYLRVLTYDALFAFERGVPPQEAFTHLQEVLERARSSTWRDGMYTLAEITAALFTRPDDLEAVFTREYARIDEAGDEWGLAVARMFQGKVVMERPELAERLTAQAMEGFRRLGDQWGIANCGQTMGMLESRRGAHREAIEALESVLPVARAIGSASDEVIALVMEAAEYDSLGEPEEADRVLEQAAEVSRAKPENHARLYLLTCECVRARRRGRLDLAQERLDELRRVAGEAFVQPVLSLLHTQQAWIDLERGDLERADGLIALAFRQGISFHYDRPDIGATLEARAELELRGGDARRAAWLHGVYAVVRGHELPLSATPDLARTAARARAALGDDAYDESYARGRGVAPDSVLDVCREVFAVDGAAEALLPLWQQKHSAG